MANDRYKQLYIDPTDLGSGSNLFEAGEVISPAKLNSWSDEIHLGFLEAARVFGDLQNAQVSSSADLIYTTYFTNLTRVIGDLDRLSPINPPGHSVSGVTYEETLLDGQYEFELDFEISGSYDTSSGSAASLLSVSANPGGDDLLIPANFNTDREHLLPGEWWTEYEDSGTVRTLKGRKLVTANISENSATITYKASTGPGDYSYYDRFSDTPTTSKGYYFNVIPTIAQAEASVQGLTGAGGFPTITASSANAVHTISFSGLYYTHYKDIDGNITIHKLADVTHGSQANNAFQYKLPQYILDSAARNGGVIPEGMISLWRYWSTQTGAHILKPAVPDLSKPSRESFVFTVIDDSTIEMTPPSTNTTLFTTSNGVRCVIAFSSLSLAEATGIIRLKMQEHKHNGTDGSALIEHNNLLLPTEGAHKGTAISFDIPTLTEVFVEATNLQAALEEIDDALLDHFLQLPAAEIPESRRHQDQNIECTPAEGLPNGDFDTNAFTNLYGDNLRRNLALLDAHLDMEDQDTNAIHGPWRHASNQIKMTPTSSQSVYSYIVGTKNDLESHKFTNATEIIPVHGVRVRPSRFSTTNWNNGTGGTVDNLHGGGEVWGFAEAVVNTDVVLDAGIDWRDKFVTGQIFFIKFSSAGGLTYEDVIPGGDQDYQLNASINLFGNDTVNGTTGASVSNVFLYTGTGSGTVDYSVNIGHPEEAILTLFANEQGALIATVVSTDVSSGFFVIGYRLNYGPTTFKRILDPANPDYVYISTPPPSQVIS